MERDLPAPVSRESALSRAWVLSPSARRLTVTRLATVLAAASLAAASLAVVGPPPVADAVVIERDVPSAPTPTATSAALAAAPRPAPPMATVDGVELAAPARDVAAVGFHEGGSRGLPMTPVDDHVVMPSRGRGTSPTSAVDIAVGADRTVTAPVSGTVTAANAYSLYGGIRDKLVYIAPDDGDVTVQMNHLVDVKVEVGDRVEVGEPIATARQLPVSSQVDRYHNGPAGPHVHMDVTRN